MEKEYKEKYETALNKYKKFYKKYYTKDTALGDVIFDKTGEMQKDFLDIFPKEESEDERIRKDIRLVVESSATKYFKETGQMPEWYDRIVAYLEKQKDYILVPKSHLDPVGKDGEDGMKILEKQKVNTDGDFARGYDCGYDACLHSHGAEWFEKQKEQKSTEPTIDFARGYKQGFSEAKNKYEQNPAEWMKEEMIKNAVECVVCAGMEGNKWIMSYIGDYKSIVKTCKAGDKVRIIIVKEEKK